MFGLKQRETFNQRTWSQSRQTSYDNVRQNHWSGSVDSSRPHCLAMTYCRWHVTLWLFSGLWCDDDACTTPTRSQRKCKLMRAARQSTQQTYCLDLMSQRKQRKRENEYNKRKAKTLFINSGKQKSLRSFHRENWQQSKSSVNERELTHRQKI